MSADIAEQYVGFPEAVVGSVWGGRVSPDTVDEMVGVGTVAMMKKLREDPSVEKVELWKAIKDGIMNWIRAGAYGGITRRSFPVMKAIRGVDGWEDMPLETLATKVPVGCKTDEGHMNKVGRVRRIMLTNTKPPEGWEEFAGVEDERNEPEIVEMALAGLSEAQATAIRMRYVDGKTVREIGEELGVTFQGAEYNIKEGLKKIRGNPKLMRELGLARK